MPIKINVKGPIIPNDDKWIYEIFDVEATCPKDVIDALDESPNEDVEVMINSGGGSVYDASEIYTALRSHSGNVQTKVVGLAASAASVIAMAGNTLSMSPTAKMMIHNASTVAFGDYRDMDKTSDLLQATNKAIASAYRSKSGMSEDELLKLMDDETWLNAEDAKRNGLIDEIMFQDNNTPMMVASSADSGMIPQEVVNKLRNEKAAINDNQAKDDGANPIKGFQIDLKLGDIQGFDEFKKEINEVKRYLVNAGLVDENGESTQKNIKQTNQEPEAKKGFERFLF